MFDEEFFYCPLNQQGFLCVVVFVVVVLGVTCSAVHCFLAELYVCGKRCVERARSFL